MLKRSGRSEDGSCNGKDDGSCDPESYRSDGHEPVLRNHCSLHDGRFAVMFFCIFFRRSALTRAAFCVILIVMIDKEV